MRIDGSFKVLSQIVNTLMAKCVGFWSSLLTLTTVILETGSLVQAPVHTVTQINLHTQH